jgi:2,3-bisphosphoglycerate-independent phosphoglycerate mutase
VEAVDQGLGQIYQTLKSRGGTWIVTADHGNAETMIDPATGGPHTYHTTNPVPFILVSDDENVRLRKGGSLRDIAPTMLRALGHSLPSDMTGTDLRMTS